MEEEFVVDEVDDSNDSGRKGRYLVNDDVNIKSPFWRRTLPRRDLVCIVIGATIIFVVVLLFIVIAVAFGSSTDSSSSNGNQEPWISPRLPTTLNPQLYTMYLDANLDTKAVTGTVSMMVYVNSPTDHIIFHAKDINILEGSVSVSQMSSSVEISNQFNFSANDYYVISLRSQLRANETVTIFMRFNYTLGDGLQGFYRSYYTTSSGEKIYVANTQFEALHARAAFPCFDEPNLKANFSIELTHPLGYSALSNMPTVKNSTIDSTKIATKFQTTYRMSTYLAAFVISNFKCSTPDSSSRIKVRVCSREDVFDSTSYALKVANIVINYYEKFFDVDYPLPKQDLVAVPDFSANAMENWGLIIYRESAIVYDKEANPASSQQRVAALIGHELAHQVSFM
jgi:aminopeptidase N